jgi:hypothetical protein
MEHAGIVRARPLCRACQRPGEFLLRRMTPHAALFLFWLCAALTLYFYAGYPLVLAVLAAVFRRRPTHAPVEPFISILVAAYNEADVIGDKIRNSLALDYPAKKIEIVVANDGSSDETADIARGFLSDPRVRLLDYAVNRGKMTALNDAVPLLRGEIIVLTDAASMLEPHGLRRLVKHFADPNVGGVSGIYRVQSAEAARLGVQEAFYWKYETFLKEKEAALGSTLGAHGALYAIRRILYPYPEAHTINDDYVIPVRVVQQGFRMVYETGAVAYEQAHEMDGFSRRVRIMAGNLQQMRELEGFLFPPRPFGVFVLLSHKGGRLLAPICMLGMAACNLALLREPFFLWLGALQCLFYALALAGCTWKIRPTLLRMPYYFCLVNAAAFFAIFNAVSGRRLVWKQPRVPANLP